MDILKDLEFEVEDQVFLKLSPRKGVVRFGKRGKLNPRYIGPFEIVDGIGPVAYRLDFPEEFSRVHNVSHTPTSPCYANIFQIPHMCWRHQRLS